MFLQLWKIFTSQFLKPLIIFSFFYWILFSTQKLWLMLSKLTNKLYFQYNKWYKKCTQTELHTAGQSNIFLFTKSQSKTHEKTKQTFRTFNSIFSYYIWYHHGVHFIFPIFSFDVNCVYLWYHLLIQLISAFFI